MKLYPGEKAIRKRIGDNLHALRSAHAWSLRELSVRSGVSTTHLWAMEHARYDPGIHALLSLSHAFHTELSTLLY